MIVYCFNSYGKLVFRSLWNHHRNGSPESLKSVRIGDVSQTGRTPEQQELEYLPTMLTSPPIRELVSILTPLRQNLDSIVQLAYQASVP